MDFKKVKNEKGITLIALAVTIVVLLILAGVSLNAVFSDNGIIKKAQHAQNTMEQAQQNDLKELEKLEEILDQYTRPEIQKNVSYREFTTKVYVGTYSKNLASLYINTKIEVCELNDEGEETGAKLIYTLGKDGTIKAKNDPNCVFNENTSTITLEEGETAQFPTIKVSIAENVNCKIKLYKPVATNIEQGYETEPLGEKIVPKDVISTDSMNSYSNAMGDLNNDGRITADDVMVVQYIISGETFPELNDYMTQENNENVITLIDENGNLLNNTLFRYIVYDINRDGKINQTDIDFIYKAIALSVI